MVSSNAAWLGMPGRRNLETPDNQVLFFSPAI
jgi:hypothetical protein